MVTSFFYTGLKETRILINGNNKISLLLDSVTADSESRKEHNDE